MTYVAHRESGIHGTDLHINLNACEVPLSTAAAMGKGEGVRGVGKGEELGGWGWDGMSGRGGVGRRR